MQFLVPWRYTPESKIVSSAGIRVFNNYNRSQARSQPVSSGKPGIISRDHVVCPVPSFFEMKEIG